MGKKLPILSGLVWLLAATVLYGYYVWADQPDGVYTYDNDGCMVGQKVYVTDNEKKEGRIYEMDLNGNVSAFFSTRELRERASMRELAADGDVLYAVMEVPGSSDEDTLSAYVILEFANGLRVARMTPAFFLYEADDLTDFTIDENGMYLAAVSGDGKAASVYCVSPEQLTDLETAAQSELKLESSLRQEAGPGREFVAASYEMGAISVRSDADLVSGPFRIDDSIRYTYSMCHMNFGQLMSLHSDYRIYWLIAVAAGWLVILLLYVIFHNRNRVVYTAMVVELVLFAVIFGGARLLLFRQAEIEEDASTKWIAAVLGDVLGDVGDFAGLSFSDDHFYTSDDYAQICDRLELAYAQTEDDGCVDLFFADIPDLTIWASTSGRNHETVDERYFREGSGEAKELVSPGNVTSKHFTLDGQSYRILSATPGDSTDGGYVLFGVYLDDSLAPETIRSALQEALILFAAASLLCILILAMQSADFRRLARSMRLVADGRTDIELPRAYGGDMRSAWRALGEIQKKIRTVNYTKYLTFEAYYRFAPKNVERLLSKESITEVASGNVTKLNGTIGLISTVGPRSGSEEEVGRMNRLIALIGRYQEEKDGVFVSSDGTLSILRFLFMEKNKDTLNCSVDFLKELEEQETSREEDVPRTTILLHYSSFVYGVAGTNQQSSTFLVSPDTDEIERFAAWFRERGLRLVISETVKERENYTGALRRIGYIRMGGSGGEMNMYEVLDAYGVRERREKLAVCDRFEQALELFYQHDFYLARNAFSDILKELPTDGISKWYLFTCEIYLDMKNAEDVLCALRYEE